MVIIKRLICLFLVCILCISTCFNYVLAFDVDIDMSEGGAIVKKDNNVENGFETYSVNDNLKGTYWSDANLSSNSAFTVTDTEKNSGLKSLAIDADSSETVYRNISGLSKNSWYRVRYYWMMPYTYVIDTPAYNEKYYGSVIAPSSFNSLSEAYSAGFSGDYNSFGSTAFVGGEWNETEFIFNTHDKTSFNLFIKYSTSSQLNSSLYIDDFMVVKLSQNDVSPTFKCSVVAENGYAFLGTENSDKSQITEEIGTKVKAIASEKYGYKFMGWFENNQLVSNDALYEFTLSKNTNLTAKFEESFFIPDVNNDDKVNMTDVISLSKSIAGWDVEINQNAANINGLGSVNLSDVILLARYIAGWEVDTAAGYFKYNENFDSSDLKNKILSGNYLPFKAKTILSEGNNNRIARVLNKAKKGEDITIVSIGGSITQGAMANGVENRFVNKIEQWFEQKFPDINVTLINCGMGSTPALLTVHRLEELVFKHNPDLVLVDHSTNSPYYDTAYEAIIRRCLSHSSNPAVVGILFGSVADYNNPTFRANAISYHLPSLKYYGVPTINFHDILWEYINNGVLQWSDVFHDYTHPNTVGHNMAGQCVNYYLERVYMNLDKYDTTAKNEIPDNYFFGCDLYDTAQTLSPDTIQSDNFTILHNSGFVVNNKLHSAKNIHGWTCENGGTFKVVIKSAKSFAFFPEMKKGNGSIKITINGVEKNINCAVGSDSGYIWVSINDIPQTPTDYNIEITATGRCSFGPFCITY